MKKGRVMHFIEDSQGIDVVYAGSLLAVKSDESQRQELITLYEPRKVIYTNEDGASTVIQK